MARKIAVQLADAFIPVFGAVYPFNDGDERCCAKRLGHRLACTLRLGHPGAHVAHTGTQEAVRIMGTPREILSLLGELEDMPATRRR